MGENKHVEEINNFAKKYIKEKYAAIHAFDQKA